MVSRVERGWAGHYCCASYCLFRRNTLLDGRIVVSTVGNHHDPQTQEITEIGLGRYHETMCFHSDEADTEYHDADVSEEIYIDGQCGLSIVVSDNVINDMHENVVNEMIARIEAGDL